MGEEGKSHFSLRIDQATLWLVSAERWRRLEIDWDLRGRTVAKPALRPLPRMRPNRQVLLDHKMFSKKGLRRGLLAGVSFFTVSARCGTAP